VAEQAKAALANGARILDVRTPEEFASGHVAGATNIPVQVLVSRIKELDPKDKPIVLYCRSGARSAQAALLLRGAGFVDVVDVGPMSAFPR
jgi:rhodanese-related sulfurtransferase